MKVTHVPKVSMEEGELNVLWGLLDKWMPGNSLSNDQIMLINMGVSHYLDNLLTQAYKKGHEAGEEDSLEAYKRGLADAAKLTLT